MKRIKKIQGDLSKMQFYVICTNYKAAKEIEVEMGAWIIDKGMEDDNGYIISDSDITLLLVVFEKKKSELMKEWVDMNGGITEN